MILQARTEKMDKDIESGIEAEHEESCGTH